MVTELKKMFPYLTNDQATALSWGGLEGTSLYAQRFESNTTLMQQYSMINTAYRNGTKGSKPCSANPE
jgi:hypothetical protein